MNDRIEYLNHSLIQHGKHSNRVYLMKLDPRDCATIINSIEELALQYEYTKIIAKIPSKYDSFFECSYYEKEATIPGLYDGNEDASFWCKYLNDLRKQADFEMIQSALDIALHSNHAQKSLPSYFFRSTIPEDIPSMIALYKQVFESYPFPIFEQSFLLETMLSNVYYYGLWDHETLIALSSIELDPDHENAEMTDFAVLPEYRGQNLALLLLRHMEEKKEELSIKTAYTIARSNSIGMNKTFAKSGYSFAGTLFNNTQISGSIESMNVWYKSL